MLQTKENPKHAGNNLNNAYEIYIQRDSIFTCCNHSSYSYWMFKGNFILNNLYPQRNPQFFLTEERLDFVPHPLQEGI